MPPALTFGRAFTSWRADWSALAAASVMLGSYVRGSRGRSWPVRRTIAFSTGVALLIVVTCGFVGVYDQALFWVRALQNIVLLMAVPMLLALGAPVTLALTASASADRLRRLGRSRPARLVAFPLTVTVVLLAPLPLLYLTGWYPLTLRSAAVAEGTRAVLLCAGFLYYWTRLRIDPVPGESSHLTSFVISFAEALVDGIVGVIVWLGPPIAAAHYALRDWGPTLHRDQTMGAIALWFGGDIIGLVYLAALFVQWFRDDTRAAARIDAELDAEEPGGLWWEQ